MLTIRTKLILAWTGLFGAVLVAFAYLIYSNVRNSEQNALDAYLHAYASKVEGELQEQRAEGIGVRAEEFTAIQADGLSGVHLQIVDSSGSVMVVDKFFSSLSHDLLRLTLNGATSMRDEESGGTLFRTMVAPLEIDDRNVCVVQIAASRRTLDDRTARLFSILLIGIPLALMLGSSASYFIVRSAFRPIGAMIEGAQAIDGENLHARLVVPPAHDEIRTLGETFNGMIDRVQRAFEGQRRFIADASHEFRTPLTVLTTELELARMHATAEDIREHLNVSLREVERMAVLTQQMLTLQGLDAGLHRERFRLDELLLECVQLVGSVLRQRDIAAQLDVREPLELTGDRERLKGALLNLIDNAIRHTAPGGRIEFSISTEGNDPARFVALTVKDSGTGIQPEDLPHVFERFYRSSSSRANGPGSGLGLAIVDAVARAHGGRVDVVSEPGRGSAFTLHLPL